MTEVMPFEIVQVPGRVVILFEKDYAVSHIWTDGRKLPEDTDPAYKGYTSGKWDGDTLVVDTIGVHDWTKLDTVGHPHSENLHLVTTFRRTDFDHMTYTVTVDDPDIYTRPWTNQREFTRSTAELIEYSCEENNKDLREGHIKLWTLPPPRKRP